MKLALSLPEFSMELEQLLVEAGQPELASQVNDLEIVDRCHCGDSFCSSFYTAPKPVGSYGPKHRNIELQPRDGMIILDVVEEKITQVEVLFRDQLRSKLRLIFP
jgi:hypothetical protein